MSTAPQLIARINASEGIMAKDSLSEAQPKQTTKRRVRREAPPAPPNSPNDRQPWSSPIVRAPGGKAHGAMQADLYEDWCPVRKENFRQLNILREVQRKEILLEPTSRSGSVRRRGLSRTWLEGEEWTELTKEDGNEEWITMSSEETVMGEWVDLGLKGDSGHQSDSREVKKT